MKDVSVVVPAYNQADLLGHALRALLDQTLAPDRYEVVVVDDGSTDDTPRVVEALAPRIRLVRFPANRGRSAARNAGIRAARAGLIVFVDSDVLVRPDFLDQHRRTHAGHGREVLSRGPVVAVPSVDAAAGARVPRFAASPAYLDTANAGVARAALERAGMFDESFPGYGWEDLELGIRLRRAGVRRVFCPQAVAFHVQPPAQWADVENLVRKEDARARSAAYFYRKTPTLETRLLIQLTPAHRLGYWLFSCGGWLDSTRAAALAGWLTRRGWSSLAFAVLRSGLNQRYLRTLQRELRNHAPAVA